MSTDNPNPSSGDTSKARRSSRNRKTTPQKSPTVSPETVVSELSSSDSGVSSDLKADPIVDPITDDPMSNLENLAPETGTAVEASNKALATEQSLEESPLAETASDNVDIQAGVGMEAGKEEKTVSLSPAKEGQLVPQASEAGLVPRVASTITIAGGKRPIMASNLHVTEMIGNRPVFASELQIYETINVSGLRPVLASHFQVVGSLDAAGHRPVGANEFEMVGTMNVSGVRPIGVSTLHITEMLTATRPIASNDIDDSPALMGFID